MEVILAVISFIIIISVWSNAGLGMDYDSNYSDSGIYGYTNRRKKDKLSRRQRALEKAKPFIKSYNSLVAQTGEICLANENCKVNIVIDNNRQKKIICISKKIRSDNKRMLLSAAPKKNYEIVYQMSYDSVIDNVFDTICENFSYTTAYENIFHTLKSAMLDVKESFVVVPTQKNKTQKVYDSVTNLSIRTNNLLNINNATEAELSALPGVNIVTAKKTIKYISKNGPFKTVEEFIEKMKIKEVFAEQIKDIICTKIEEDSETKSINENTQQDSSNFEDENTENFIPHSENERIIDI